MPNMSYCRFENTALDLAECVEAVRKMADGQEGPLGRRELEGFARLLGSMADLLNHMACHTGTPAHELADLIADDPKEVAETFNASVKPIEQDEDEE